MTKSIDKLIADHETMSGLISSLIDYHERLNDYLAPCLKDDYTHNDLETLQQLATLELKGGDTECN